MSIRCCFGDTATPKLQRRWAIIRDYRKAESLGTHWRFLSHAFNRASLFVAFDVVLAHHGAPDAALLGGKFA